MSLSIGELARTAGISSRTLRHYHHVGLLEPAWVSSSGRRHYEQTQLLRLQEILLLRRLGLGLAEIADVLDLEAGADQASVLRRHRGWLSRERRRLGTLIRTIDRTIEHLEEGRTMAAEAIFEGFERNPYEAEARERWGDEAVDASKARLKDWSAADAEKARTGYDRVHNGLAPLLADGVPVDDRRVQDLIQLHYEVTSLFWTPNAEAYRALGRMYVEDQRFRLNIGQGNDAVVEYLRDAMAAYADARLE